MDGGTRRHTLVLTVAFVAALLVVGAGPASGLTQNTPLVGVAGAQGDVDCPATSDGAVFVTDSGLEAVHDGEDVGSNPFVDETTLSFPNVTLRAADAGSIHVTRATEDQVCVGSVEPTAAAVVVSPAAGPTVTVVEPLDRLSYGAVDYGGTDDEADLFYEASQGTRVQLAVGDDYQGETVEAVDDSSNGLAAATVDEEGTATLDLPAGAHEVNLRVEPGVTVDESTDVTVDDETTAESDGEVADGAETFEIRVRATNAPVEAGASLEVVAVVENTGERDGTQTVTLTDFDGRERDTVTVHLGSGETNDSVPLVWQTTAEDAGTDALTVATEDDSASTTVTVEQSGGAHGWSGDVAGHEFRLRAQHVWGTLVVGVVLGLGGSWLYVRRD